MKKILFLFGVLAVMALSALGQVTNPPIFTVLIAPSGACAAGLPNQQVYSTGVQYSCQSVTGSTGTWGVVGAGAGGPPTGTAGGDLSGTYPNPGVAQVNGAVVPTSAPYVASNSSKQLVAATTPLLPANNLSDVGSAATARTNLGISIPVVAAAAGDLICAQAADSTIHALTPTVGSSTASTMTYTVAAVSNDYYVGQLVQGQGNTPSGYNGGPFTVTATTATTVTVSSANNPAAMSGFGTISLYCSNQVNDSLYTGTRAIFANSYSVAANSIAAGSSFKPTWQVEIYSSSAAPSFLPQMDYGTTMVYWSHNLLVLPNSAVAQGGAITFDVAALSTTLLSAYLSALTVPTSSNLTLSFNGVLQPTPVVTSSTKTLNLSFSWNPTGVVSATYVSGGSFSGTGSCTLGTFNNSSTATGTIAVSSGTPGAIAITARGQSATAAPTTAVPTTGTATCSGTITITSVLGGASGNAALVTAMTERQ